jgi:putative tricarboxylic transport membrane protein
MLAELLFGAVALAIAAVYYAGAGAIPASLLDDVVGSSGLPRVYAVALAVLAAAQIARTLVAARTDPSRESRAPSVSNTKALGMLALGVGYGALLPWLGYAASIGLLLAATAAYQGAGLNRRVVAVALAGAALLWALFVWALGIPQPAGIWSSL